MKALRFVTLISVIALLLIVIGSARSGYTRTAPSDWLDEGNIEIYDDRIVIYIDNASISSYKDTNSMIPVLDSESNGIRIVPDSPDDIAVGDIVSYEAGWVDSLVVHRVVGIGEDSLGRYYLLRGDNNIEDDPEKVRFEQIRYVTVILIY